MGCEASLAASEASLAASEAAREASEAAREASEASREASEASREASEASREASRPLERPQGRIPGFQPASRLPEPSGAFRACFSSKKKVRKT